MADEEKTETVIIGRNVTVENIMYGRGTYLVTPRVAALLRARNATASVASHMAAEKRRAEEEAAREAAAAEGGGGEPSKTGVIIGGGSKTGEGGEGGSASGGSASASQPGGGAGASSSGGSGGSVGDVESLTGELPEDFPKRAELAKGAPDADPPIPPVTRYEELTKLTADELDKIPGIGQASVEVIGQRLFADAEKAAGGGGGGQ
jgi:hypothetical protein